MSRGKDKTMELPLYAIPVPFRSFPKQGATYIDLSIYSLLKGQTKGTPNLRKHPFKDRHLTSTPKPGWNWM